MNQFAAHDLMRFALLYASKFGAHLFKSSDTVVRNSDLKVTKFKFYADHYVRLSGYALGDRVYVLNQKIKEGCHKN
ncbi:hypothetical protein BpHYR1_018095 [Brachionus plicatilis]|uniref:Uncharacterized protein n=1 Tax=Brachionus plicatilis TaxID=10195 RepID=A0A3M7SKU2_BRAPC|nr:hypothetical protein BpHYR1_018095 [Brachionus plicatilis]